MNKKPNVMIAISHGLYEPWISILENGQKRTWLQSIRPQNVEIVHFHGTPVGKFGWKLDRLHESIRWFNRWLAFFLRVWDRIIAIPFTFYIPRFEESKLLHEQDVSIHIKLPDTYRLMRWKDLAIFDYFLKCSNAHFIFMTTTSSYINIAKLNDMIEKLPLKNLYAGVKAYKGAEFAAGNNRLISRDVVEQIVRNRVLFDPGYIEDYSLGKLMTRLGIIFKELPSLHIQDESILEKISFPELNNYFHIRVKSGTFNHRNDVYLMNVIHERLVTNPYTGAN